MRIGILTGGGDAPGLNGIIEAATKVLMQKEHQVIGIHDSFEGIFDGRFSILSHKAIDGIHQYSGTILGTSNRCSIKGREQEFVRKYKELKIDALIAAGGDGTFKALSQFTKHINIIGVPKTIDNDLAGTDITFGYDTACSVVATSINSLRATAKSHKRTIFVETMGRTAGWIALGGGITSYADAILIPERPFDTNALIHHIRERRRRGKRGVIVAVAEGAYPIGGSPLVSMTVKDAPEPNRLGGIAEYMARVTEKNLDMEARHIVLGHLQRSTPPSTTDRFLSLSMGVVVGRLVHEEKWGSAVVYRQGKVEEASIEEFFAPPKLVDKGHRWVRMAQDVDIFI